MNKVHRIIFLGLLLGAIAAACVALEADLIGMLYNYAFIELLKLTYFFLFTVVFWLYFYYELLELSWSARGKNGADYKKFYEKIKKDLFVCVSTALSLIIIYWTDESQYKFTGIDIGATAIPFIFFGLYTFIELKHIRIGGEKLSPWTTNLMPIALLIFSYFAFITLKENSSGKLSEYQSIWYQITILFAGFYFYMSSNKQLFLLKRGKIVIPESQKYFFREVIKSKSGILEQLEELVERKNKVIIKLKSQHSAELRKSKKQRR